MAENKLNEMIGESLEKVKELAGTETVIGEPIYTQNGTVIIPVSKVSMGFATGSFDYDTTANENPKKKTRFGGGGGTGLSVTPVGFLVCDKDGGVEFINVSSKGKPDPVDQIADLVGASTDLYSTLSSSVEVLTSTWPRMRSSIFTTSFSGILKRTTHWSPRAMRSSTSSFESTNDVGSFWRTS